MSAAIETIEPVGATVDGPLQLGTLHGTGDIAWLRAALPVPVGGWLAVNSFLLHGREPLLVDTGLAALGDEFIAALSAEIPLESLRWIWISHTDADHIGNLAALLKRAPQATVVASGFALGKLAMAGVHPPRQHALANGERLVLPDRSLLATQPPYYDAPETMGFVEERSGQQFVVDAFGALLPEVDASPDSLAEDVLVDGLRNWAALDAPWLADIRADRLRARLEPLRTANGWLTSHLPITDDVRSLLIETLQR